MSVWLDLAIVCTDVPLCSVESRARLVLASILMVILGVSLDPFHTILVSIACAHGIPAQSHDSVTCLTVTCLVVGMPDKIFHHTTR